MNRKPNFKGLGIALGIALGTMLGAMTGNMGAWLAVGIAIGLAIGMSARRKTADCSESTVLYPAHQAESRNERSRQ